MEYKLKRDTTKDNELRTYSAGKSTGHHNVLLNPLDVFPTRNDTIVNVYFDQAKESKRAAKRKRFKENKGQWLHIDRIDDGKVSYHVMLCNVM